MTNKEVRAKVKEQSRQYRVKYFGYIILWAFLSGLVSGLLNIIPVVGNLLGSIAAFIAAIGIIFTIIRIYEGKGDGESPVSFISHGIENFGRVVVSGLWVCLKLIVPIIVYTAGYVMFYISFKSAIEQLQVVVQSNPTALLDALSNLRPENPALGIVGSILMFVGFIWMFIKGLSYGNLTYEIVDAEGQEVEAKALVERSFEHMQGHQMQWFKMIIYYCLLGICLVLICIIPILGWILAAILGIIVFYSQFLSQWELHKSFVGSSTSTDNNEIIQ